jgi:hypothetical protein
MSFVTDDEIAQAVFGADAWADLESVDQNLVGPIKTGVEAAIAVWLNDNTTYTSRDEILYPLDYGYPKHTLPVDETRRSTDVLYLSHTPVLVSSVVVYEKRTAETGTWAAADQLTINEDYQLEDIKTLGSDPLLEVSTTGAIRRLGGKLWPYRPGAVRVMYNGGFDANTMPDHWQLVKSAVYSAIRDHYVTAKRVYGAKGASATGPMKSENIGKYSYTIDGESAKSIGITGSSDGGMTPAARAILQPLVDYGQYF